MRARGLLLLVCLLLTVVATQGFSTGAVTRGMEVTVAPDQSGFVGIVDHRQSVRITGNGTSTVTVLTVQNTLTTSVTYQVRVLDDGPGGPSLRDVEFGPESRTRLAGGERAPVVADIRCDQDGTNHWSVQITAIHDDWTATVTRDVAVRCASRS